MTQTLRGIATVNFYATNHAEAVKWYSDFLEMKPYFNVPGYSEFRIGDYQNELGIIAVWSQNPSSVILIPAISFLILSLFILVRLC